MAGFDATFRFLERDRPIVAACAAAMRRRARVLNLRRISIRFKPDATVYAAFDGQTYRLDIYLERLRRDLPTIAEATEASRTPTQRREVANGLVEILWRYRVSLYDERQWREPEWIPLLRARNDPFYRLPHELWTNGSPNLQDRVQVTMHMLASWHYDEVAPEVLLEEMHTAAELMLKSMALPVKRKSTFAELVDAATDAGNIRARNRDVLLSLKDARRFVKHSNANNARAWLRRNFWEAAEALERLAEQTAR